MKITINADNADNRTNQRVALRIAEEMIDQGFHQWFRGGNKRPIKRGIITGEARLAKSGSVTIVVNNDG